MNNGSAPRHFAIYFFITSLLLISLLCGCESNEKAPQHLDSLTDVQLLPQPSLSADLDPTTSFISIVTTETQTDFPNSLTFTLEAQSSHQISDIELRYQINKVTAAPIITSITPEFTPDINVVTSWTWDTRKSSLPPGAQINFKWIVTNAAQDEVESEITTLTFEDSRHSWNEIAEGDVRLFWYEGNEAFAQELMEAAQSALDKLAQDTGAHLEKTVLIYIYANTDELQDALIFPQKWTGGLAFTDYGITAIGISPEQLDWGKRTIAHELTHLVVRQVTYSPLGDVPTWLNEGLAMYAEGDLRNDMKGALEKAASSDTLFSIRSLGGSFPADPKDALLAYSQSYSIVTFLIENFGSEKMLALLEVFKTGSSYDDALLEVYGFDVYGLNAVWIDSLGVHSTSTTEFDDTALTI